nr:MAG TPA: hypothetical protein [Caudoviricetes sp.]
MNTLFFSSNFLPPQPFFKNQKMSLFRGSGFE